VQILPECSANLARDFMRLRDVDAACPDVEPGIECITGQQNATALWSLRFIRVQLMVLRGQVEQALKYLESLPPPQSSDTAAWISLNMHPGVLGSIAWSLAGF